MIHTKLVSQLVIAMLLVLSVLSGTPLRAQAPAKALATTDTKLPDAIQALSPSIVTVTRIKPEDEDSADKPVSHAGVVVDPRGYIVIPLLPSPSKPKLFTVRFADQKEVVGQLVAIDESLKFGVLKIERPEPVAAVSLAKSREARVDERVRLVPSPASKERLGGRVTSTSITLGDEGSAKLIQTDVTFPLSEYGSLMVSESGEPLGIFMAARTTPKPESIVLPLNVVLPLITAAIDKPKDAPLVTVPASPPAVDLNKPVQISLEPATPLSKSLVERFGPHGAKVLDYEEGKRLKIEAPPLVLEEIGKAFKLAAAEPQKPEAKTDKPTDAFVESLKPTSAEPVADSKMPDMLGTDQTAGGARRKDPGSQTQALPDTPAAKQLVEQLAAQESAAAAEAATIRQLQSNGQAEQNRLPLAEHQRKLKNLLSTAFDLKLQLEELQVKELQARLSRLERQIGQRKELREKIINRRATELIEGDALKWNSSDTVTSAGPSKSVGDNNRPNADSSPVVIQQRRERVEVLAYDLPNGKVKPSDVLSALNELSQVAPFGAVEWRLHDLMEFAEQSRGPGVISPSEYVEIVAAHQKSRGIGPFDKTGVMQGTTEKADVIVVDLYSGSKVLIEMSNNPQHVKLSQTLNALPRVQVNFREVQTDDPRAIISATVTDSSQRCLRESQQTQKESTLRAAINAAIKAAGIKTVCWEESASSLKLSRPEPPRQAPLPGAGIGLSDLPRTDSGVEPRSASPNNSLSLPDEFKPYPKPSEEPLKPATGLLAKLQGAWELQTHSRGPNNAPDPEVSRAFAEIKGNLMTVWTETANKRVDAASILLKLGEPGPPQQIDVIAGPNDGDDRAEMLGLIEVTDDVVRICFDPTSGSDSKRPEVFAVGKRADIWELRRKGAATETNAIIRQPQTSNGVKADVLLPGAAEKMPGGGLDPNGIPRLDSGSAKPSAEVSKDKRPTPEQLKAQLEPFAKRVSAARARVKELEVVYFRDRSNVADLQKALDELALARKELHVKWIATSAVIRSWNADSQVAANVAFGLGVRLEAVTKLLAEGKSSEAELKAAADALKRANTDYETQLESQSLHVSELTSLAGDAANEFELPDESIYPRPPHSNLHPAAAIAWLEALTELKLEFVPLDDLKLWHKAALRIRESKGQFSAGDLIVVLNGYAFESLDQAASGARWAAHAGTSTDKKSIVLHGGLSGRRGQELSLQTWNIDYLNPSYAYQAHVRFEIRVRADGTDQTETRYVTGTCVSLDGLFVIAVPSKSIVSDEPIVAFDSIKGTARVVAADDQHGLTLLKLTSPKNPLFAWVKCRSGKPSTGQLLRLYNEKSSNQSDSIQDVSVLDVGQTYAKPLEGNDAFVVGGGRNPKFASGDRLMSVENELQGLVLTPSFDPANSVDGKIEASARILAMPASHIEKLINEYRRTSAKPNAAESKERTQSLSPLPNDIEPLNAEAAASLILEKLGVTVGTPVGAKDVPSQFRGGLPIVDVIKKSAADQSGFRKGDILVGLHGWETLSLANAAYVLRHPDTQPKSGKSPNHRAFLVRDGETLYADVAIDKP